MLDCIIKYDCLITHFFLAGLFDSCWFHFFLLISILLVGFISSSWFHLFILVSFFVGSISSCFSFLFLGYISHLKFIFKSYIICLTPIKPSASPIPSGVHQFLMSSILSTRINSWASLHNYNVFFLQSQRGNFLAWLLSLAVLVLQFIKIMPPLINGQPSNLNEISQ